MREILFKAKRIDNGEWVEGFYFQLVYDGIDTPCIGTEPLSANGYGEIYKGCYDEINPETVCQCTGLTDKNGVKIFEGDIVYIGDWECESEVRMSQGAWMIMDELCDEFLYDVNDNCKVIGSIHDKENTK